jgi:hypothetical protein
MKGHLKFAFSPTMVTKWTKDGIIKGSKPTANTASVATCAHAEAVAQLSAWGQQDADHTRAARAIIGRFQPLDQVGDIGKYVKLTKKQKAAINHGTANTHFINVSPGPMAALDFNNQPVEGASAWDCSAITLATLLKGYEYMINKDLGAGAY